MKPEQGWTKWSIISNLNEAKEELETLISKMESEEESSEYDLLIGFQHAYHHINFAWNTRKAPDEKVINLTQRDFIRWGKFPVGRHWAEMYQPASEISKIKQMPKPL